MMGGACVCWVGRCTGARVWTRAVLVADVVGIVCPRRGFVPASDIVGFVGVFYVGR